ncbi:MAG: hypothetical protein ABI460_09030 [Caldimonas sp.]
MSRLALRILWPAFLFAGVLEMMVFAVIDPGDMRWFGGAPIGWSPVAIYSITFFIFWGTISGAGALTALLSQAADEINAPGPGVRSWP